MLDGLTVSFRGLLPDEGLTSFARRLYAGLPDGRARATGCTVRVARSKDGQSVRVSVELCCRLRAVNASSTASAQDACRALTGAFGAAALGFETAIGVHTRGVYRVLPGTARRACA